MSAKIIIIQFLLLHKNPLGFMFYRAENTQTWLEKTVRQFLLAVNMVDVGAIIFSNRQYLIIFQSLFLFCIKLVATPVGLWNPKNKSKVDNYSNWLIMCYDVFKCVTVFLFTKHTFPHY